MTKALLYELGNSISFGRLSLKGKVLWPMLLAASDDQGRGIAEPDVVKWQVCPNVNEITISEIPSLLEEMQQQEMIHLYDDTRKRQLYQVVRWWEFQQHTWAHPSRYEAPELWVDRARYQAQGGGHIKENWDHPGGFVESESDLPSQLPSDLPSQLSRGEEGPQLNLTKPNLTKPNQTKPKKDTLDSDSSGEDVSDYEEVRETWISLFPKKPQPRSDNRTLRGKVNTRMKSAHFRDHWREALTRASHSTFLNESGFFDLGWFLKNDDNWQKCFNGNYDNKGAVPLEAESVTVKGL